MNLQSCEHRTKYYTPKLFNFVENLLLSFLWQQTFIKYQKQPPEVFCKKRCSYEFPKIHRKTPVPKSLFSKVAGLRPATLLKKSFCHSCFPVNFTKFLRTPFLQNTSGQMSPKYILFKFWWLSVFASYT